MATVTTKEKKNTCVLKVNVYHTQHSQPLW